MQSLNVYHASYCSSMLTTSNWASLGEPLQTLSELLEHAGTILLKQFLHMTLSDSLLEKGNGGHVTTATNAQLLQDGTGTVCRC